MKNKPSKIKHIEFRLEQLEMALMNLMFVVANQEEELPNFTKGMKRAEKVAKDDGELLSLIIRDEGAEA
tara:strand:+ start:410 stop:616 length:207 start_codon:yes stop_codon:yes gene_type:complete